MNRDLILGTRGSQLATTQSQWVADKFPELDIKLKVIKTEGDDLSISLTAPTKPGAFVNALRNSLLNGEVDFIVHSMKDLPSEPHPEIAIAAIPLREDPRDVLVSNKNLLLNEIPSSGVIGTSSPRRTAVIKSIRPDLICTPIRGNVDTRIQKIRSGEYAGAILAAAGISRINRLAEVSQYFSTEEMIPAPAQGALAVECRANDFEIIELLSSIDDPSTRIAVTAERAILQGLKAGCDLPIGAFAHIENQKLTLTTELGNLEDSNSRRFSKSCDLESLTDFQTAQNFGLALADLLKSTK